MDAFAEPKPRGHRSSYGQASLSALSESKQILSCFGQSFEKSSPTRITLNFLQLDHAIMMDVKLLATSSPS